VKQGFKQGALLVSHYCYTEHCTKARVLTAFKHWSKNHPLYGKKSSPPLEASLWWTGVIQDTFRNAGVEEKGAPIRSPVVFLASP
jgi:hypothetical protein